MKEYQGQFRSLVLNVVISAGIMGIMIMILSYLLSNYYVGRLKKLSLEMKRLQEGNLNVQLPAASQGDEVEEVRALQVQINPHFLYNTLDLVNWIDMDYGAEDIEKIAWNLARFYRLKRNRPV